MWTEIEGAGAWEQALWSNTAVTCGVIIAILAGLVALYLMAPILFGRKASVLWEFLLTPVMLPLRGLGMVLPKRGPWKRYVYEPVHLAVAR